MVRWGFCLPSDCTEKDLQVSLEENMGVKVSVNPEMCQRATVRKDYTFGHYMTW